MKQLLKLSPILFVLLFLSYGLYSASCSSVTDDQLAVELRGVVLGQKTLKRDHNNLYIEINQKSGITSYLVMKGRGTEEGFWRSVMPGDSVFKKRNSLQFVIKKVNGEIVEHMFNCVSHYK